MKSNQEYKNAALDALRGHWAPAVIAAILYALVVALVMGPSYYEEMTFTGQVRAVTDLAFLRGASSAGFLLGVFVLAPLALGLSNAFRYLYERRDDALAANLFKIPLTGYLHKVWGLFLMGLFIFLWTLLLVIPGIIKAFSYAMTPYILDEHPELSASQAIDRSREMMRGHKFDLFWLYLSFIGWFFLAILTCGIGFFWLVPYVQTSVAAFYYDLKLARGEAVIEGEVVR